MKNMKKSIITLGLLALGLAGCGGSSESSVSASASVEQQVTDSATSTAAENEASIRFLSPATTVERGNTITLRVSVTTEANDMSAIFQSDQDGDIIELDSNSSGVVSIKVTGLAVGKATITAIASCNHKVKTSIEIEVTPRLSSLQTVWKNVAKMKNYTLTSKNGDDVVRTTRVTDTAITTTEGADETYMEFLMNDNGEMDSNASATSGVAGLALDKNGYAYYLIEDGDSFKAPGNIVKANTGLLNADNFTGLGTDAGSWMEVDQYFYGLAAINPSWLTSKKSSNNVYDIQYEDDDDYYTAFAEALLVGLVAPELETSWLQAEGKTSFTALEVSDAFETSVTVLSATEVKIAVTYNSNTVTGTLSDIGTTEQIDSVKSFLTANATAEATAPEIDSDLLVIKDAMLAGDYVETTTYSGYGSFTTYTTSNYIFYDYTAEFIAAYKNKTGKDLASGGAFVTNDGATLQGFTYTPAVTDDEGNVTTEASITLGQSQSLVSNGHTYPFCVAYGTFGSSLTFLTDLVYTFMHYTTGGENTFISYSKDVSDDLSERYFGDGTLADTCSQYGYTMDSYTTALTPVFDTTDASNPKLTSLNIEYGSFYENGSGPYAYNQKLDSFGHATENDAHALLVANGLSDSVSLEDYLAGFAS